MNQTFISFRLHHLLQQWGPGLAYKPRHLIQRLWPMGGTWRRWQAVTILFNLAVLHSDIVPLTGYMRELLRTSNYSVMSWQMKWFHMKACCRLCILLNRIIWRWGGMHSLNPQVLLCGDSVLTHAVFHHHEATLVSFKALALKISRRVHAGARSAQVRWDAALIDVYKKGTEQCSKLDIIHKTALTFTSKESIFNVFIYCNISKK